MHRPRSAAPANSGLTAPGTNWADYLGKKISIRYRFDDPGAFSEAVGVVQAVRGTEDNSTIEIIKRNGETVTVKVRDITHLKLF